MNEIFIGIDLAWGEKNLSGFCALQKCADSEKLKIIEIKLLKYTEEILRLIQNYKDDSVYVGIDAPLVIPNDSGNRDIEKNFNKDFCKYKISMLPVNRKIMSKYSQNIRSEELYKLLAMNGFVRDYESDKTVFEVYPHSTIAVCFNNMKILPYKRKKGRDTEFIKRELLTYKNYLLSVIGTHPILEIDVDELKGQRLKDYEDMLDSITCAYTMFYCKYNRCKQYSVDGIDTFITPIEKEQ